MSGQFEVTTLSLALDWIAGHAPFCSISNIQITMPLIEKWRIAQHCRQERRSSFFEAMDASRPPQFTFTLKREVFKSSQGILFLVQGVNQ